MSSYYAPCFYRIDFVVIPSCIELPCLKAKSDAAPPLQDYHYKSLRKKILRLEEKEMAGILQKQFGSIIT